MEGSPGEVASSDGDFLTGIFSSDFYERICSYQPDKTVHIFEIPKSIDPETCSGPGSE